MEGTRGATLALALAASGCSLEPLELGPGLRPRDAGPSQTDGETSGARDGGGSDLGPRDLGPASDGGFGPFPTTREPVLVATAEGLWRLDPEGSRARPIGLFMEQGRPLGRAMGDIALDLRGRLFGGTEGTSMPGLIWAIDPTSGACRRAFEIDDLPTGLTFTSEGELVVAGEAVSFYDVDSGALLRRFERDDAYRTSGDIVGLPNGKLYWSVLPSPIVDEGDGLVELDPRTGEVRFAGALRRERVYGLAWFDGALLGFDYEGFVVTIRPSDGRVLRSVRSPARWYGATTNPVVWP